MKILFAAIGSYGDINPYLAIAKELLQRGHKPVIATSSFYRTAIEQTGVGFVPLHPDARVDDVELVKKVLDRKRGSETIIRELVMPVVREMYADLQQAAAQADLLVSHALTYAVPVVAEKTNKPWVSTVLSPLLFCSRHDLPVFPQAPWLTAILRPLGPEFNGWFLRQLKRVSYSWSAPLRELRAELGLPPGQDPLWEGQHSPWGVLALFSKHFSSPQPDWPGRTAICGFPFLDQTDATLDTALVDFLAAGDAPLVFTLGSSAVMVAGNFYNNAIEATLKLNRRAVLVAGPQAAELSKNLPASIKVVDWALFPPLFQRAAVVVHSGGIGTTAQALRGGRPQLGVPFANDQFDNTHRVVRLGLGGVLAQHQATPARLIEKLEPLIDNAVINQAAVRMGEQIRQEDGVAVACDQIERSIS